MAKFVCCGLILEATILKKEIKFTTKALNLSYQKKMLFYGLCSQCLDRSRYKVDSYG